LRVLSTTGGVVKTNGTTVGVLAALGISVTAAIALPLVNVFKSMEPSELMVVRGGVTAVLIALVLTKHIGKPSKRILTFSLLFSLATLALYAGIRAWGASPTLVVLTATPVVNIAAKVVRGQSVDRRVYACLTGLLLGVMIALNPWQVDFDLWGFSLSVAGLLLAGVGFEVLAGQKGVDPYNKSFWLALVTVIVGLVTTLANGHLPFVQEVWGLPHVLALIGFGVTGGFAYYLANIVAFEKLRTEVASTLAMAETPAVIVGAWLMLGETLTLIQWIGVAVALGATAALSATEARQKSNE
jgi:drug/metabolite transporter (DMT)-like permease